MGTEQNTSPELAVGGDGGAVAVWRMDADGGGVIKWAGVSGAALAWGTPQILSTVGVSSVGARVVLAPNGNGAIAWIETSGVNFKVRLVSLTWPLLPPAPFDIVSASGEATALAIAVNPSGDGGIQMVWTGSLGGAPHSVYYSFR